MTGLIKVIRSWRTIAGGALTLTCASASFAVAAEAADPAAALAPGQQVSVPLSLDYPLLEKLLVTQLFTGPGRAFKLPAPLNTCSDISLREPALSGGVGAMTLRTLIEARVGIGAAGSCSTVFRFDGRLAVAGTPEIRQEGRALAFAPQDVRLIDDDGEVVRNDAVEGLAAAGTRSLFNRFEYDLEPQLNSIGEFLPDVLPRHSRNQIETLVQTLRITRLDVGPDAVHAQVGLNVEAVADAAPAERALTDAELVRWEERWQAMDTLLVLTVKRYAAATSLRELRDALLDALIESRYRLRDALAQPATGGPDAVRQWFLQSWRTLAPVLRRIGMEQPGQEQLLLLNVVTATDALNALDAVGPSVGLEISVDGLRRLARMINDGNDTLIYSSDLDPALRRLLEGSLESAAPASSWHLEFSLFPAAVAADSSRLNRWAPQRNDLPEYLPSVAGLLRESAGDAVAKRGLAAAYEALFRNLVLSTAWQESCWRHYVVNKDRKLVPLRSGTGDVGLMQINERVWRGFYDQQRLRWDISYNSEAGAEVLVDYLMKYALRKGEHRQPGGLANLARASYSAYNGGPSRISRYRSADASTYGRKVDAAFWEKYQQVAAGNEMAVSTCLGGNLSGRALAPTPESYLKPSAANTPITTEGRGTGAAPAASDGAYVLQLGAFSTEDAARTLIQREQLEGRTRVFRRGTGASTRYLVLFGSFATRAEADAARAARRHLEPWVRRVSDL